MENIVIDNECHRAVLFVDEAGDEATTDALVRGWQDVLDVAGPQYPDESFVPNEKPLIVEYAIQREVSPHIGHYPHPDDSTGRTALCGLKIYPNDTVDGLAICPDCQALFVANDAAPLPE